MGDATYAAKDDKEGGYRKDETYAATAHPHRIAQSVTEGVALNHLIGNTEGDSDKHGEEHSHPFAMEAALHIIGWSAIKRLLATALVELGQSGLHKSGGRSEHGHHPHPEHSARSANKDGGGYTSQIAGTHTA